MLFSHNKPEWLYRLLPALYVSSGVFIVLVQRSWISLTSGALLMGAGALSGWMRGRHRRCLESDALEATPSTLGPVGRYVSTIALIQAMTPAPCHPELDRQHRLLAADTVKLRLSLQRKSADADVELAMHELLDALGSHLADEDVAMRRARVDQAPRWTLENRAMLEAVGKQLEALRFGERTLPELVERITGEVETHLRRGHPVLLHVHAQAPAASHSGWSQGGLRDEPGG